MRISRASLRRGLMLAGVSALALAAPTARAQGPEGGVVLKGRAAIWKARPAGPPRSARARERAVIDWRRFDVGPRPPGVRPAGPRSGYAQPGTTAAPA